METHWPNTYSYSCVIMNDPENQKLQSNTTRSSSSFPISLETGNLQGIIFSMWNSVQSIHSPSTQGLESRIWKGRSDCLFSRIESHRFRAHTFIIMPSDRSVLGRKKLNQAKSSSANLEGIPQPVSRSLKPIPVSPLHAGVSLLVSQLDLQRSTHFSPNNACIQIYICMVERQRDRHR